MAGGQNVLATYHRTELWCFAAHRGENVYNSIISSQMMRHRLHACVSVLQVWASWTFVNQKDQHTHTHMPFLLTFGNSLIYLSNYNSCLPNGASQEAWPMVWYEWNFVIAHESTQDVARLCIFLLVRNKLNPKVLIIIGRPRQTTSYRFLKACFDVPNAEF